MNFMGLPTMLKYKTDQNLSSQFWIRYSFYYFILGQYASNLISMQTEHITQDFVQGIIKNSEQFPYQQLKVVKGQIPKQIRGTYLRNGPGKIAYGNNIVDHWFFACGAILKVVIENGKCWAQYKDIKTQLHSQRQHSESFYDQTMLITSAIRGILGNRKDHQANTSVLPLKNSDIVLALAEGGIPLKIRKKDLFQLGFDNFDSIKRAYSAHPKIDPQNGDIYNIGMQPPNLQLMKHTSEMKPIASTLVKLRTMQSIHDFCLAGQYIVILEPPTNFGLFDMFKPASAMYQTYNPEGTTMIHIFKKDTFELVKKIQVEPFYSFHFTNGYSTQDQIVFQICKYEGQNASKLLKFVRDYPKASVGFKLDHSFKSVLEEKRISLKDFSVKSANQKIICQFPVCNEQEVGKNWRYSYFLSSKEDQIFFFNELVKFDRFQRKITKKFLGDLCSCSQPMLIPIKSKNGQMEPKYILCAVVYKNKSYIQIFDQKNFKEVCLIELPVVVPNGFHGKWEAQIYN